MGGRTANSKATTASAIMPAVGVGFIDAWTGSDHGMGIYLPCMRRDLDIVPMGKSCRAPALLGPADQYSGHSTDRGGLFIPCGAVSTRGSPFSSPRALEWSMHGKIFGLGMGPYRPRARLDHAVVSRANFRRALAPLGPVDQQSANRGGVSTPGGARYRPGGPTFSSQGW